MRPEPGKKIASTVPVSLGETTVDIRVVLMNAERAGPKVVITSACTAGSSSASKPRRGSAHRWNRPNSRARS
jgi:hypothetical protein